jgi:hypothetical protein
MLTIARTAIVLAAAVVFAAPAAAASADALSAPPPVSGCPTAALVIGPAAFDHLVSLGYRAPTRADVNGDHTVCAIPFKDTAAALQCPDCPAGFYLFSDNTHAQRQ